MSRAFLPLALPAALFALATVSAPLPAAEAQPLRAVTHFPAQPDGSCAGKRAKLYDLCADQVHLYHAAFDRARAENKILLVSYGAEWCVWCHVFARTVSRPGAALEGFAASRFVIVNIEAENAPRGPEILSKTAVDRIYSGGLPLIFTVAPDGTMAAALRHQRVAGGGSQYDLAALKAELQYMHDRANTPDDPFRQVLRSMPPVPPSASAPASAAR